jgi:2-(1,2-epoxy-1,2-dihydrophenyl)acetyl-CoA isomerase
VPAGDDPVVLDIAGGVATVRLNRPGALNVIDERLAERFLAAVRALEGRDVRAVVLRSEGRGFSGRPPWMTLITS